MINDVIRTAYTFSVQHTRLRFAAAVIACGEPPETID